MNAFFEGPKNGILDDKLKESALREMPPAEVLGPTRTERERKPVHRQLPAERGENPNPRFRMSPARKIAEITLGIVLVVLGLIGGLLPVIQGWMFGVPGLILLARHFKWAHRILDWAKKKWDAAKAGGQ